MTSKTAGSRLATGVPLETQVQWLRRMLEIRSFEDECHQLFARGLVRGSTHLCQGQEAVEVGACSAVRPHGMYLPGPWRGDCQGSAT